MSITFWGGRTTGGTTLKVPGVVAVTDWQAQANPSSPLGESKYPCEDCKTAMTAHFISQLFVPSYLWTLTYLSLFCHLCQEYTSPTRRLRVFVLWCCWEFAEITWDLSCLPRFYCCPWVPGWLEGVDSPVDHVSSCVILLHCDMWLCLSLPSTSFTHFYDV